MKILIDILHPAHVHFFRNFIKIMEERGHKIVVTARDKDVTLTLLKKYDIPFVKISKIAKTKFGLAFELLFRTIRFFFIALREKPDVLMGCMGPTITPVGVVLRVPRLVFYNNETAKAVNSWAQRLATAYITSTSYNSPVAGKHITHKSYHELAYLHPKYFTADEKVLAEYRIKKPFSIVRMVSWQSSHDMGAKGISDVLAVVKELEKHGSVYITSEKKLPAALESYRLQVAPEKLHDVLAFASMCVGESATLASEAACLGVPAVYIANTFRGYTDEQEKKFGLVFNFSSQIQALAKIKELFAMKDMKKEFAKRREKMLKTEIDVTQWMVEFVEGKGWKSKL